MSAGEPSTWYDQGSASDMTARLPFCDCRGDTTVNGATPAAQFGEVLEINLQASVRLARAAMAVMRPAG
jgi:hypothetical protein